MEGYGTVVAITDLQFALVDDDLGVGSAQGIGMGGHQGAIANDNVRGSAIEGIRSTKHQSAQARLGQ